MALYNASGNFRVTVGDTTRTGIYAADGSLRVTVVSGSTYTGLFAADGSYNVVIVNSTDTLISVYHACGAFRAVSPSSSSFGVISPNGALYMDGLVPQSLFANNEPGVWFDPSDLSTMFQDAAGTTPVTAVEQPVGLHLDKSKGLALGAELVPGSYAGSVSGGWVINSANVTRNSASSGLANLTLGSALSTTKVYLVTFTVANLSGDTLGIRLGGAGTAYQVSANGTYTARLFPGATTAALYFIPWAGSAGEATITNISIREIAGNHRYQGTSAARPTLSARYNQIIKTEDVSDSYWTKANTTTPTASTIQDDATANFHYIQSQAALSTANGVSYTLRARLEKGTMQYGGIHIYDGYTSRGCSIDLNTGTLGTPYNGATATAVADGSGWIISITYTAVGTYAANAAVAYISNSNALASYTGTGTGTISVSKFDFRPTNETTTLPAYQRVNTSTDYDTSGFPMYLKYDGTDDFMQTASVDFSATDAVSIFAGARKLADTTAGMLIELTTNAGSTAGAFAVLVPENTITKYAAIYSRGSVATAAAAFGAAVASPVTTVIGATAKISTDSQVFRENGTQIGTSASDQGAGNYSNAALYFGARAGTSLFFNGREYQTVIRGAASSAAEIAAAEAFVNLKTKAY